MERIIWRIYGSNPSSKDWNNNLNSDFCPWRLWSKIRNLRCDECDKRDVWAVRLYNIICQSYGSYNFLLYCCPKEECWGCMFLPALKLHASNSQEQVQLHAEWSEVTEMSEITAGPKLLWWGNRWVAAWSFHARLWKTVNVSKQHPW